LPRLALRPNFPRKIGICISFHFFGSNPKKKKRVHFDFAEEFLCLAVGVRFSERGVYGSDSDFCPSLFSHVVW